MSEIEHVPIVIAGGGIVGILCAYELSLVLPSESFILLERSPFFGDQASGRNSSVLHSGLYYAKDSLKLTHCKNGLHLWSSLNEKLNFGIRNCGKYILGKDNEIKELQELYLRGIENQIGHQRWISSNEKNFLSSYYDFSEGFFISATSTIDVAQAIKKITHSLEYRGNMLLTSTKIRNIQKKNNKFLIESDRGTISSSIFINAAGGGAVDLRKMLGLNDIENEFVKGHYVKVKKKYYGDSLIYPIPLKNLKGLGLHTSFDADGSVRFGPDTLDTQVYDYSYSPDSYDRIVNGILKTFKGLDRDDLSMDYCGIRHKIKLNGNLYPDFWYQSHEGDLENYIELLGIESPGLTASPSLAKMIVKDVLEMLN